MKVKIHGVRQIRIAEDYIRLDALLKYAAIASTGGEAKYFIQKGKVYVCGAQCTQRGKKICSGDIVRCGGNLLRVMQK